MIHYTVYHQQTDEVLAIGSQRECAKKLGISLNSFQCILTRVKSGKQKNYVVVEEDLETGEMRQRG